jgi:protein N-terminal methyltransferase
METDKTVLYENGKKHWSTVTPTVDGMLGQYGYISSTDLSGSKSFLAPFLSVSLVILFTIGALCC